MEPGMGQCRVGEGPNTFDTVTALERWVEQKKAPDQISASHSTNGKRLMYCEIIVFYLLCAHIQRPLKRTADEGGTMRRFSVSAMLLILSCVAAYGQGTAQISGRVTDQSGAVLPGVEVTATQTDTGIPRSTITNETGSYVLPNLALGPYKLEVSLPGFRTFVQNGIVLQVNSNPVINTTL
jgi:hypothetical protein